MKTKLTAILALFMVITSNAPVIISFKEKGIAGGEVQEVKYGGDLQNLAIQLNIPGFEPGTVLNLEAENEMAEILERDALNERYLVESIDEKASHLLLSAIKLPARSVTIHWHTNAKEKYTMMDCSNNRNYNIHCPIILRSYEYNLHKLIRAGSYIRALSFYNKLENSYYHYHLRRGGVDVQVPLSEEALQILASEYDNLTQTPRKICLTRVWAAMDKAGIEVQEVPNSLPGDSA